MAWDKNKPASTDVISTSQADIKNNFTAIEDGLGDPDTFAASGIKADSVRTASILNSNVTAAKLATDSVETAKIKDLNVTTGKLAADAVNNTKVSDDAIQAENILGLSSTGSVTLDNIADGSTNRSVKAATAGNGLTHTNGVLDIAAQGVGNNELEDNSISSAKMGGNSVPTGAIQTDAVDKFKINDDVAGDGLERGLGKDLYVKPEGNTILVSASGIKVSSTIYPVPVVPNGFKANQSSPSLITIGTGSIVILNSEDYDGGSTYNTSTGVWSPGEGLVWVSGWVVFDSVSTGIACALQIVHSVSGIISHVEKASVGTNFSLNVFTLWNNPAGGTFTLNAGADTSDNIRVNGKRAGFSGFRLAFI